MAGTGQWGTLSAPPDSPAGPCLSRASYDGTIYLRCYTSWVSLRPRSHNRMEVTPCLRVYLQEGLL